MMECIGYECVVNNLIYDFLQDKAALTSSVLCSLSIDIISAIDYLQNCGISNNNINPRSIVICENDDSQVKV
ncbi:hypothetical protein AC249_AIPGENE17205 [Exaiptasia diaphana]|nr:hypothetical protein AC249_AIPGENE17205 [Exaiptasia diaphana]